MTIASMIGQRAGELALSDGQAARRIGVSQPTFTRWRIGTNLPRSKH
mgnify:FL=1